MNKGKGYLKCTRPIFSGCHGFHAAEECLPVLVAVQPVLEKIIIDERTGTVISGINIKVEPVIISHGAITIQIDGSGFDPAAPAAGDVDIGNVAINANTNTIKMNQGNITVANITRALNKLGATPKEIIAIIENLKRAGAIQAGVEVI